MHSIGKHHIREYSITDDNEFRVFGSGLQRSEVSADALDASVRWFEGRMLKDRGLEMMRQRFGLSI